MLIGAALFQGYKGISKKFLEGLEDPEMSREVKRAFTAIGVFGTSHPGRSRSPLANANPATRR